MNIDEIFLYKILEEFPGGPVVNRPPAQCRGPRFDPWSKKIPHAVGQLTLYTTATDPVCHDYGSLRTLEPVLHNKTSHCNEKPAHCN